MRLIDADYLEMVMTEDWFLHILVSENDMSEAIRNCIDSVPLAYDVKSVISKMEKERAKSVYDHNSVIGEKNVWTKAIEIVIKGGVDNAG